MNRVGTITIRIGKNSKYDGYYINMKNGTRYKLYKGSRNDQKTDPGTYLVEKIHVPSRNIEKMKFFNDWL